MASCALIIPVYEHVSYLSECLDSAIGQTSPFNEIIVVDDCSPDPAVQKILSRYKDVDRVRIFRNEINLGITKTQNYAVSLSNSEFVAFLDCDDVLHNEARAAFDAYHELGEADYFFSNRYEIDPAGKFLRRVDAGQQIAEYETLTECLLEHMVASHFKVIRRSALDSIGGFPTDSDGVQDWVVAVNIIRDDNAVYMAEYLYSHRIHPGQTTGQDGTRYVAVVNAERERLFEQLGLKRSNFRSAVQRIAPFLSRVPQRPGGAFLLKDGSFMPWSPATAMVDGLSGAILFYMPGDDYYRTAQNFYLTRRMNVEVAIVVDKGSSRSIATTRWASAFVDHIICTDPIARLAVEPWIADKSKIVTVDNLALVPAN